VTPDDPRHGKRSGYLAHRKAEEQPCDPCSAAHTRHCKEYRHRTKNYTERARHPATAALELLDLANAAGITDHAFAAAAGLSTSAISRIRLRYCNVNAATLQRIQAALANLTLHPNALVEASLTHERVKSMMAQAWARNWIVAESGWVIPSNWLTCKRVRYSSAVAIRDLALQVGDRRGPSKMSATWAAKSGWQVAAAWDDPGTVTWPVGWFDKVDEPISLIDESAIERRILGDRTIRLHKGEAAEIVRRLVADGWTLRAIAQHTGVKPDRYIERPPEPESVIEEEQAA
jgi:hypothetical protein